MTDVDRDHLRGKPLTQREKEAVRHLAMDGSPKHKVIADAMGISPNTVRGYLYQAGCKLDVYFSYTGVLVEALRQRIVTFDELVAPAHVKGERR